MSFKAPISSLCTDFVNQAVHTWDSIAIGRINGMEYLEETLTDNNLNDLQIKHPFEIRTKRYSKPEEGIVGADWEWWLVSQSLSPGLGLRVQAKKIDSVTLDYPHLDYVVKKNKRRQVDSLIDFSQIENPPRIPICVLYNQWDVNQYDPPWLCGTFPKMVQALGCTVIDAYFVRNLINKGLKNLKDLANKMYPWNCLVCCHGFARASGIREELPYRAFEFLNNAFRNKKVPSSRQPDEDAPFYERDRFVTENVPSYVRKIAEGVQLSEDEWRDIKVSKVTVIREMGNKYSAPE